MVREHLGVETLYAANSVVGVDFHCPGWGLSTTAGLTENRPCPTSATRHRGGAGVSSATRTGQSQKLAPIGEGKGRGVVIRLGGCSRGCRARGRHAQHPARRADAVRTADGHPQNMGTHRTVASFLVLRPSPSHAVSWVGPVASTPGEPCSHHPSPGAPSTRHPKRSGPRPQRVGYAPRRRVPPGSQPLPAPRKASPSLAASWHTPNRPHLATKPR